MPTSLSHRSHRMHHGRSTRSPPSTSRSLATSRPRHSSNPFWGFRRCLCEMGGELHRQRRIWHQFRASTHSVLGTPPTSRATFNSSRTGSFMRSTQCNTDWVRLCEFRHGCDRADDLELSPSQTTSGIRATPGSFAPVLPQAAPRAAAFQMRPLADHYPFGV